jgi:hypothetical protein
MSEPFVEVVRGAPLYGELSLGTRVATTGGIALIEDFGFETVGGSLQLDAAIWSQGVGGVTVARNTLPGLTTVNISNPGLAAGIRSRKTFHQYTLAGAIASHDWMFARSWLEMFIMHTTIFSGGDNYYFGWHSDPAATAFGAGVDHAAGFIVSPTPNKIETYTQNAGTVRRQTVVSAPVPLDLNRYAIEIPFVQANANPATGPKYYINDVLVDTVPGSDASIPSAPMMVKLMIFARTSPTLYCAWAAAWYSRWRRARA